MNKRLYYILRSLAISLPYSILKIKFNLQSRKLKRMNYPTDGPNNNNMVVSVVNNFMKNGGLSDRINGIISTYKCTAEANRKFKILFTSPFDLKLFLVPNEIDWIIKNNDIEWSNQVKVIALRPIKDKLIKRQLEDLKSEIIKNKNQQIHIYSNIGLPDKELVHTYFHKLFKPSEQLRDRLEREFEKIGLSYISVTYRFQQLLGDFVEGDYEILDDYKRENLIDRSIKTLMKIHDRHPEKMVLVTSDSKTFLDRIKDLDFTHVIEGKLVHMDYNESSDFDTHVKSFLDLFLIAHAEIVYSVITPPLYNSGFPRFAAQINNRPIKIIE